MYTEKTQTKTVWVVAFWLGLFVTMGLGIWLRWVLTGASLPSFLQFRHLKHAHSHLGYYAVLFPLIWLMWHQRDGFFLSRWTLGVYVIGIILSTAGFLRAGYCLESIVGSSLVGGIWLISAWKQRHCLGWRKQWLASVPLGILLASLCVPPIAVMTRRQPTFALQLVQTFLSVLLFLVAIPTVLERLRLTPPWAWYWFVCGLSGALFVGVLPHPVLGLGLVGMAVWIQYAMIQPSAGHESKLPIPWELHGLWSIWTLGTAALGIQLLPNQHHIAVAGLHFTLLGPFLMTALFLFVVPPVAAWWRWTFTVILLVMVSAIAAPTYFFQPWLATVSALAGLGLGILCAVLAWVTGSSWWVAREP